MTLTVRELDLLIDMAENRLSDMMVVDREDVREHKALKSCVGKLQELRSRLPRSKAAGLRDLVIADAANDLAPAVA
jgi:hypothetical protein